VYVRVYVQAALLLLTHALYITCEKAHLCVRVCMCVCVYVFVCV